MIEEILSRLGFNLKNENSKFWRARPIYRESGNDTSLRINKLNGSFIDFSANVKGSIYDLIRFCFNLSSVSDAKKWLDDNDIEIEFSEAKPKPQVKKTFPEASASSLMPNFSFYSGRGISMETLARFECGVQMSGKQNNRFVFPIRDFDGDIIGLVGRDLLSRDHKWKILGRKTSFVYPIENIGSIEGSKYVFLVESIGDMLALSNAGYKNVFVMFGVAISNHLINFLSTMGLEKIYISTNNDSGKTKNSGQIAALEIKEKLEKFLEPDRIEILTLPKNDWGDMSVEEIKNYVEELHV